MFREESTSMKQKQVTPTKTFPSAHEIWSSGKSFLIYGTAWKKEETTRHVVDALHYGFRFIDTACQPKHYNEAGVGDGWTHAAEELGLKREDIFIQTKFTSIHGQDPNNIPYEKNADLDTQIRQSLEKSLSNLKTTYIDSLVLHSPFRTLEETLQAWKVFESFVEEGKVKRLGLSNCYDFKFFKHFYSAVEIKPRILQNRFRIETKFDVPLREFCDENNILYQSFWTLTANRKALRTKEIRDLAKDKGLTPQTLMYAYMMTQGHTPLDGTTSRPHMQEDIQLFLRLYNGEEILNTDEVNFMSGILGVTTE
eukprot:CAMPEP_0178969218 /NCGR_PEP_ID=MMETSP0789-20121207/18725_1 /TAXON_ID=3005 /ORGANISM="Rhizosolenia setigera, Strain CCMP 1694" /LENGTH=309 /DNA_ID=CAMNT_0020655309 /DNA_START=49 /DNA_END=978 /DNA_ORIENTATION=+